MNGKAEGGSMKPEGHVIRNRAAALLHALEVGRETPEVGRLEQIRNSTSSSSLPNSDFSVPTSKAVSAFQKDMRPVCGAVVSALEAGDMEALRGLRALLPHLLAEVNRSPALADLLAHQLGKSLLAGLNAEPEEAML